MDDITKEFLLDMESEINKRRNFQNFYKWLRITLMVTIAVCGFITAAASQVSWFGNNDNYLFIFGLISAVCAVLNQSVNPTASNIFHQNARKAMQYIEGEVKYGNMEVAEAHRYKSLAMNNPEIVLGKLEDMFAEDVSDEEEIKTLNS